MRNRTAVVLFALAAALPLSADEFSIAPSFGPTSGGTEVTIKGDFPGFGYGVSFGGAGATDVRHVDAHTLVAVTPENLPGVTEVRIVELPARFLPANLQFTYVGDVPASYERILLPIFLDPIHGQFGSEFVTSFSVQLQRGEVARLFGLRFACRFFCPPDIGAVPLSVSRQFPRLSGDSVVRNGNPGRFLFVPKDEVQNLAMNLRVFDRSRSAQNFGTELPIVRESRFTEGYTTLTLVDVPTDARFRNTLRIYATGPANVIVRVEAPTISPVDHEVELQPGGNVFEPATATFSTFPTGVGPATVTISIPTPPITPPPAPRMWAFVAVTNNDTQMITTVTPQP